MATATTLLLLPLKPVQQAIFLFPSKSNFPIKTPNYSPKLIPRIPFSTSSSFKNGNSSPEKPCPVPFDQQPINEYKTLIDSFPFSWAAGDFIDYCARIFFTGASFALFVALPVAWFGAVGPQLEPVKRVMCAVTSGVFVMNLAVVRMYLGWAYIGNRLFSATVEYEETGWYDGQTWVKTAEVLARDRLLGSYTVKPVLNRLKYTLAALTGSLVICAIILINIDGVQKYLYPVYEDDNRVIHGVYSEESARSFEPEAFCGEPDLS